MTVGTLTHRAPARGVVRQLLGPTLTTALLLAILLALGAWQVERLQWKTALLAAIDRAEAAPGVELPASPVQFEKVRVTGVLQPDQAGLYASEVRDTLHGPALGAQLIEPMVRPGAAPVLVDLGWVPEGFDPHSLPSGIRTIEGYVRLSDRPGLFTPADEPASRHFYTLAPAAIGSVLGRPDLLPYTVVALGAAATPPIPADALPRPPNNHLQYAITWFSLAGILVVIYARWAWKALHP